MSLPSVYSVPKLAARWDVTNEAVYTLIRSGELHAFKLGGKLYRIREDEIERFEWRGRDTPSNDCEAPSLSSGTTNEDVTDIRLERLIERPRRPQLVHSGNVARPADSFTP